MELDIFTISRTKIINKVDRQTDRHKLNESSVSRKSISFNLNINNLVCIQIVKAEV